MRVYSGRERVYSRREIVHQEDGRWARIAVWSVGLCPNYSRCAHRPEDGQPLTVSWRRGGRRDRYSERLMLRHTDIRHAGSSCQRLSFAAGFLGRLMVESFARLARERLV